MVAGAASAAGFSVVVGLVGSGVSLGASAAAGLVSSAIASKIVGVEVASWGLVDVVVKILL